MQFFRRLFHHLRPRSPRDDADGSHDKNTLHCVVQYLDNTEANFNVNKQILGRDLYELVYNDLDFQYEHEYFGLQYTDFHSVRYWIDPTKPLKKQIKKTMPGPPYTFRFVVKFFSSEPDTYLKEELTCYLYVLQLKADLAAGKLVVNDEEKAAEMAALVLQSEEGDYDPEKHDLAFVSQFRFLPEEKQTEEFEVIVLEEYQKLADRNLTPSLCEKMYLNKVKYLENYGVDMHKVQGKDDRSYQLGLTPAGILVYDGDEKIGFFYWQRISKIVFSRANLKIVVSEDDAQGAQQDHTFVFKLADTRTCKHLWRCAVEHHTFFRLVQQKAPPSKTKQLLRLRSRFYHSFRTETGLVQANQFGTSQRRSARFERKPSTRHSCRPSFVRADAERQLYHRRMERPAGDSTAASASGPRVVPVDSSGDQQQQPTRSGPDTIETKAIIVSTGIPEENHDDDMQEAEVEPLVETGSPQASPTQAVAMATKLPLPQISPVRSAAGGSPLPSPAALSSTPAAANCSSSGQSDSGDSSALSQRTVIEVAAQPPPPPSQQIPPPPSQQIPPPPSQQIPPPPSQQIPPPANDSSASARRPSQTISGLRPPTAIPKLTPTPPSAQPPTAAAASLNGGEKSLSASALPAPKVLAQKQQPPPPSSMPAAATVSASSLPRRLSASDEANGNGGGSSSCGGSRIPAPSAVATPPAAASSAAPRSRIPALAPPPPPPPPQQQQHTVSASSLPQPRAGVSGIPRLAPAPATSVGPQFSLKL